MCGLWCSEIADPDIDIEIWGRLWNAARVRAASTSPKLVKSIQKWKGRENLARSSSGWIAIFIEFGNFYWYLGFLALWNESKTIIFCALWSSLQRQAIKKARFLVRSLRDTTTDEPSSIFIWNRKIQRCDLWQLCTKVTRSSTPKCKFDARNWILCCFIIKKLWETDQKIS